MTATIVEQDIAYGIVRARQVRAILKRAGLAQYVDRVTTASRGTNRRTRIALRIARLVNEPTLETVDEWGVTVRTWQTAQAVADAINAAYAEAGRRADAVVYWRAGVSISSYAPRVDR